MEQGESNVRPSSPVARLREGDGPSHLDTERSGVGQDTAFLRSCGPTSSQLPQKPEPHKRLHGDTAEAPALEPAEDAGAPGKCAYVLGRDRRVLLEVKLHVLTQIVL